MTHKFKVGDLVKINNPTLDDDSLFVITESEPDNLTLFVLTDPKNRWNKLYYKNQNPGGLILVARNE